MFFDCLKFKIKYTFDDFWCLTPTLAVFGRRQYLYRSTKVISKKVIRRDQHDMIKTIYRIVLITMYLSHRIVITTYLSYRVDHDVFIVSY